MISIYCFTNIDDYQRKSWPESLACRPLVGDWMQSTDGLTLKVGRITHAIRRVDAICVAEPYLRIELHRP
jgi:hypothetical protein